jgi:hypothetical protein
MSTNLDALERDARSLMPPDPTWTPPPGAVGRIVAAVSPVAAELRQARVAVGELRNQLDRMRAERDHLKAVLKDPCEQVAVADDRHAGAAIRAQLAEAERDKAKAALDRVRDVAATLHDIGPYDDNECAVGCPGCQIEHAISGSRT